MPLTNLNDIVVHNDMVDIHPGNRLIDVYSKLEPYGRIAIGGRLKTISASGLLLIGGFHYSNSKYGISMDNVVSYDVVLGNLGFEGRSKQLWDCDQVQTQDMRSPRPAPQFQAFQRPTT